MVVLEEAHKFLTPAGVAAVDLRHDRARNAQVSSDAAGRRSAPGGIDPEVISQIGTRITGLLTDESDIAAVLSGGTATEISCAACWPASGPSEECLILGHAIQMPMMLRTRKYDAR